MGIDISLERVPRETGNAFDHFDMGTRLVDVSGKLGRSVGDAKCGTVDNLVLRFWWIWIS